jgi:hypothetical protein
MSSNEYRVTFGLDWHDGNHPTFLAAHSKGWLTVIAADLQTAQKIADVTLGEAYAHVYPTPFRGSGWAKHYPMGELARIEASLTPALPKTMADALFEFTDAWATHTSEVAAHLTCTEVEQIARLFEAVGNGVGAQFWREQHAADDDCEEHQEIRDAMVKSS